MKGLTFVRHPELKQSEKKPSFHVKFCGDGTNVSRKTGMCVMSFSLFSPDVTENVSSPHHAVAVVKGHESYDMYRVSFSNIWKSINTLHDRGTVDIHGESYGLKDFLAADYKFLLLVLGMSGATSNHACVCTVRSIGVIDVTCLTHTIFIPLLTWLEQLRI